MMPLIMPIGALLSGVALLLLGSGLLNTLLALKGELLGYGGSQLGLIMSGYFAGFFVGTFFAIPLVARIGHIRAFACCAAIAASSVLLHALVAHPLLWILFRVLTGASLVILYSVIESWLNGQAQPQQRGRIFAVYMTVNLLALAAAQQLIRIDEQLTFVLFALSAMLVTISLVPVTLTRMKQPEVHAVSRISPRVLFKAAPIAVYGAFLSGLAMGAFWGLGASFAVRSGLTVAEVGVFVSSAILGGAAFQFPLGRFSDGHDRRLVLAIISALAAVIALLLIPVAGIKWASCAVIALYGGLAFALYPLSVAHLIDHLDSKDVLAGGVSLLLIHGVGAMIGPMAAGVFLQMIGTSGLPIYWVIILAVLSVATFVIRSRSAVEVAEDHAADFVPMIRTTPAAFEMLPNEEDTTTGEQHGAEGVKTP